MITVQNAATFTIETGQGEMGFTNAGTWEFAYIQSIRGYTNDPIDVSNVRDGSVIVVDSWGHIAVSQAPDLIGFGLMGMGMAGFIGLLLGVKYVVTRLARAGGIPTGGLE